MAVGPKRNEGGTVIGERPGTRCVVRYVRASASKARVVLDTIRGLGVGDADALLAHTQRGIAPIIRKALASAVANAENNDNQAAEELYVSACFADEGPTIKRFRPRARGRAMRINKRTCHITVVVSRLPEDVLERRRATEAGRGRGPQAAAVSRRERVARSRQAAVGAGAPAAAVAAEEPVEELVAATEVTEAEVTEAEVAAVEVDAAEAAPAADTAAAPSEEKDA
jgi:large subunit ribosomal protein L22